MNGKVSARSTAIRLLVSYFKMLFELLGLEWTGDNTAEVIKFVDSLADAAVQKHEDLFEDREQLLRSWKH